MTDTPLTPAQLEARIRFLRSQRLAIEAELRHLLGAGRTRPRYHCLRCGQDWEGLYANRVPAHCARCHSAGWQTERARKRFPNPRKGKRDAPASIAKRPWDGDGIPPPPVPTLPAEPYVPLSQQFRRRMEEPQPESRITVPTEPIQTESVVETVQHNMDEAVREMTEGVDAGIKTMMDDTPRTLEIVEQARKDESDDGI